MLNSLNTLPVALIIELILLPFAFIMVRSLRADEYRDMMTNLKKGYDAASTRRGKQWAKGRLIWGMFGLYLLLAVLGTIGGKGFFLVGGIFGMAMCVAGYAVVLLALIDFLVTRNAILEDKYFVRSEPSFNQWFAIPYVVYMMVFLYVC